MMFVITKWHKDNPNVWVALEMTDKPKRGWGKDPNKYILRGRHKSLATLVDQLGTKKYAYARSWGAGVGKDMKIGESRDEYRVRKEYAE